MTLLRAATGPCSILGLLALVAVSALGVRHRPDGISFDPVASIRAAAEAAAGSVRDIVAGKVVEPVKEALGVTAPDYAFAVILLNQHMLTQLAKFKLMANGKVVLNLDQFEALVVPDIHFEDEVQGHASYNSVRFIWNNIKQGSWWAPRSLDLSGILRVTDSGDYMEVVETKSTNHTFLGTLVDFNKGLNKKRPPSLSGCVRGKYELRLPSLTADSQSSLAIGVALSRRGLPEKAVDPKILETALEKFRERMEGPEEGELQDKAFAGVFWSANFVRVLTGSAVTQGSAAKAFGMTAWLNDKTVNMVKLRQRAWSKIDSWLRRLPLPVPMPTGLEWHNDLEYIDAVDGFITAQSMPTDQVIGLIEANLQRPSANSPAQAHDDPAGTADEEIPMVAKTKCSALSAPGP